MYCFNTQPPEGGCAKCQEGKVRENLFQHTAARRRLHDVALSNCWLHCFNTQPPEGGCLLTGNAIAQDGKFQHTAARRRLLKIYKAKVKELEFQHTAARRRLLPSA